MAVAPYPFERVARLERREAALQSAIAAWIGARPHGERLARLVGGAVSARVIGVSAAAAMREHDARCEVRIAGAAIEVRGASAMVRRIAQRLLGGPSELGAPRPLTHVERAMWALVVATGLEDLGVGGEVWPDLESAKRVQPPRRQDAKQRDAEGGDAVSIEIEAMLAGAPMTIEVVVPRGIEVRVPPHRTPPAWTERVGIDAELVIGRCALPREAVGRLSVRDIITIERAQGRGLELQILGGSLGLAAEPGAVVAEVVTGYVRRDMAVPDDAHVELSVALGTMQLTLRQVCDLAVGQILTLGRPLAGPFEVRAAGRIVGQGELVDVDGELGVRIVSLSSND